MSGRRPYVLLEILVMLLVFSVVAAGCLKLFAWAESRSVLLEEKARATVAAQNAAEQLKATCGDHASLGGTWDGARWCLSYDEAWNAGAPDGAYFLWITPEICSVEGLAGAQLELCRADGQRLICLTVRWQEVGN